MSYLSPPLLASTSFTTLAGNQTTTIIAAPGPGFALRVAFISVAYGRASTGIANITFRAPTFWETELSAVAATHQMSDAIVFPEPGVQLTANTPLTCVNNGSVAGDSVRVAVGYYIDAVP